MSLVSYHLLKALFPKRADYLDMGYGIKARAKRCREFWAPHIAATRSFQRRTIRAASPRTLAVLGAGRLLDVDLPAIFNNTKRTDLFDADPSAVAFGYLKLLPKVITGQAGLYCAELSGRIDAWSKSLSGFLLQNKDKDEASLVSFLHELAASQAAGTTLNDYDAIVSLNLLSQIPLYWRDRVVNLLSRCWGYDQESEEMYSEQLRQAIRETKKALQQSHLSVLNSKTNGSIVLITDSHFYFYHKDAAQWEVEEALFCSPEEALSDGFTLQQKDSWLWHIAPQDIEQKGYGVIHRVEASHWTRAAK